MDMIQNRFKAALREPGAQIGLWIALANGYAAEVCAGAGFDWLMLDGEHAPGELQSMLAQLQALAPYRSHPVIRPRTADPALIKQLLDIGAQTLLVPMIDSAQQAQDMVRAMRYPPAGIRGVGSAIARASRFNRIPNYLQLADAQMCLLVQVESRAGLDNVDAIASVDGVDGVFIGPADLCAALGHLGNPGHPEVQEAIEGAIARVLAAGKAPGILTADERLARRYIDLGCRFVAVGTDITLLVRGSQALLDGFRGTVPAAPTPASASPGATY
ncbi:4-hydroxy-2-oxoheptanedioate aldolase [Comamonadaceae bacterium G21597-S1]|nr:4-hydroxy-2-oxoheptanedioate aldolase [Comamonadaceae bacterium G21597-S1]